MCEIVEGETYGYRPDAWERAKAEAIRAIGRGKHNVREVIKGLMEIADITETRSRK